MIKHSSAFLGGDLKRACLGFLTGLVIVGALSCGSGGGGGGGTTIPTTQPPILSQQPQPLVVLAGQSASFMVSATGTAPLVYQWRRGGTAIAGATSATYSIAAATTGDSDTYSVVVSNAGGSVTSNGATLTVNARLAISPDKGYLPLGRSMRLEATGGGSETPSWTIVENGGGSLAVESGGRAATYTAPSAVGTYTVRVSTTSPADVITSSIEVLSPTSATNLGVDLSPLRAETPTVLSQAAVLMNQFGYREETAVSAARGQVKVQFKGTGRGRKEVIREPQTRKKALAAADAEPSLIWWVVEGPAGGSIDADGQYTPPETLGVYHIGVALAADPKIYALAEVAVTNAVAGKVAMVLPSRATVSTGQQAYLTAVVNNATNPAVAWNLQEGPSGGILIPSGGADPNQQLYFAPSTAGTYHARATSLEDASISGLGFIDVVARPELNLTPTTIQLAAGQSLTFQASVSFGTAGTLTWSLAEGSPVGGTLTANGTSARYTAPMTAGLYHVRVESAADPTLKATSLVQVSGPVVPVVVTVAPAITRLAPGTVVPFTATVTGTSNQAVTWSASAGSIDGNGLYTAPLAAGSYTVQATSVADPTKSGTSTVRVANLPSFTSVPPLVAYINAPYAYTVNFVHPDGLPTTLSLQQGPTGAILTGSLLAWTPTASQTGTVTLVVKATDSLGGIALQQWDVDVRGIGIHLVAGALGGDGYREGVGGQARFGRMTRMAIDPTTGNLVVTDSDNHLVRRVTTGGATSLLAGSRGPGNALGNGAAAKFNVPRGVAVDVSGNAYVMDRLNSRLKKISPTGDVTVIANLTADHVAVGSLTNLFVPGPSYIRKITQAGSLSTFVGSTTSSGYLDGLGTAARFSGIAGIASDAAGNLYVTDNGNKVIRKIDPAGNVSTVAGQPGVIGAADGPGGSASFSSIGAIASDTTGNLFIADKGAVRKVSASGQVSTWLGAVGTKGHLDAAGPAARFDFITSLALGTNGTLYISDGPIIRAATVAGQVSTLAGSVPSFGYVDGVGGNARFNGDRSLIQGMRMGPDGNLYVVDSNALRKVSMDGTVTTVPGTVGAFAYSAYIALDSAGNAYIADGDSTIKKVPPAGGVSILAGTPNTTTTRYQVDGIGAAAQFNGLQGIVAHPNGQLYVLDNWFYGSDAHSLIREIGPTGVVTTLATYTDTFESASALGLNANGNLVLADLRYPMGSAVFTGPTSGAPSLLSGSLTESGFGDGNATTARFGLMNDLVLDAQGNIYLADTNNFAVREVTPTGQVSTLVGGPTVGAVQLGPLTGNLSNVWALERTPEGHLLVSCENSILRIVLDTQTGSTNRAPQISSVTGPTTVTVGQAATFTITASDPDGDTFTLSTPTSGATISVNTLTFTAPSAGSFTITVVATDTKGATGVFYKTISTPVLPSITTQPQSVSVALGQTATFSVVATGTAPLTYQWRKNLVTIPGATNASYTTPAIVAGDTGTSFTVVVTNVAGSVTSAAATLTVIQGTFSATGNLGTAQNEHTATLLPNGKVLIACGNVDGSGLAGAELYDPDTATFSPTGSLSTGKTRCTATLLPNGKVLISGDFTVTAELYDPATGTFGVTGSMSTGRQRPTATLLPSGKVLIAGGSGGDTSAELYNLASGTFTLTGNLATARNSHTATLLPNGKVLLAGGTSGGPPLSSGELYDPATGTFTATGSMSFGRWSGTATLLPNGKVLMAGGFGGGSSAELYDPATGTFGPTGSMSRERQRPTATLLANGKVLISGGGGSGSLTDTTELYDPATGTFSPSGRLNVPRELHTATLLPNGKVLIAGGNNQGTLLASAELFDPQDSSPTLPAILVPPQSQTVTVGDYAYFTVNATGTLPLSYQWRKNTSPIPGATSSSFLLASTVATDAGSYDVVVTNTAGNVISNIATLIVNLLPPQITDFHAVSPIVPFGSSTSLQWTTSGTETTLTLDGVSVLGQSSATVQPVRRQGYTLVATNAGGSVTQKVVVAAQGLDLVAGNVDGLGQLDGPPGIGTLSASGHLVSDPAGNVYFPDNHAIRKMAPDGTLSTFVGAAAQAGYADGSGNAVRFNNPQGIVRDSSGNLFVFDINNRVLRKITPAGVVSTFAGQVGVMGAQDGTGATAVFGTAQGLAIDTSDNIYVPDSGTIRKVTPGAVVTTLAGDYWASSGNVDGTGSAARFGSIIAITTDPSGNIWGVDLQYYTLRKITPSGVVTTVAGSPGVSGTADGLGSAARFSQVWSMTSDATGNLYVADRSRIRMITPSGDVTTVAGALPVANTLNLPVDGLGTAARFTTTIGITHDAAGNFLIVDWSQIRKATAAWAVSTMAGLAQKPGYVDGPGNVARFGGLGGTVVDSAGTIHVADYSNKVLRNIDGAGNVSWFAGIPGASGATDGGPATAQFSGVYGLTNDLAGNLYAADYSNRTIRKISPSGVVTTLAGSTGLSGSVDGTGSAARFVAPMWLAFDGSNYLYVGDSKTLRRVHIGSGDVVTLAGSSTSIGASADGTGALAKFSSIAGVTVSPSGDIYVLDASCVRKISPAGVVTTLAGTIGQSGRVDGLGSSARFSGFTGGQAGIACDSSGTLWVADGSNFSIRKVLPNGAVTTLLGTGLRGVKLGAFGTATLEWPKGISITSDGDLVFTTGYGIVQATAPN